MYHVRACERERIGGERKAGLAARQVVVIGLAARAGDRADPTPLCVLGWGDVSPEGVAISIIRCKKFLVKCD